MSARKPMTREQRAELDLCYATIATQAEELTRYREALMQIANNMMATPEDAGSYFRAVAVDALSRGSSI